MERRNENVFISETSPSLMMSSALCSVAVCTGFQPMSAKMFALQDTCEDMHAYFPKSHYKSHCNRPVKSMGVWGINSSASLTDSNGPTLTVHDTADPQEILGVGASSDCPSSIYLFLPNSQMAGRAREVVDTLVSIVSFLPNSVFPADELLSISLMSSCATNNVQNSLLCNQEML